MSKYKQEWSFTIFLIIIGIIFTLRLTYIQLIKGKYYRQTSAEIRARLIPSTAPRGIIYDRYGHILASNKPAYAIYILPSELKNKSYTLKRLAEITSIPQNKIIEKINSAKNKFEPILIQDYASFQSIALLEEDHNNLPGVNISNKTIRYYPHQSIAAHILGHVGEISPELLKQNRTKGYRLGEIVGLSGIEKAYDQWLRGIGGGMQVEVDAQGRPIKRTQSLIPIPGKEIYLTIDLEMQKQAEQLIYPHNGAIVVLDTNTGEVLSLVSKPSFDPNDFAGALTKKEWEKLTTKSSNPFHNRALTSYPPGSIYKIITAIAALEEKLVTAAKQFFCRGYFLIGRRKALCWTTHGNISFFEAIVHSCDVVFYNLGLQLGIDKISEYAVSSGLGTPTGIDIPLEESGLIPSEEWKLERYGTSWYPGDSMNAAIGQGYVQTTPLQMATLIAACASTRNSIYRPFLCQKIVDQQGNILFQNNAYEISKLNFSLKNMDIIREALLKVVEKGTGRGAYNQYISIAGKTGTAEDPPRQKPHAWFICYAPYENPKIAIAVFIESGGHGGHIAVPIAHDLIIWWNKHRNKEIPENVIKKVH